MPPPKSNKSSRASLREHDWYPTLSSLSTENRPAAHGSDTDWVGALRRILITAAPVVAGAIVATITDSAVMDLIVLLGVAGLATSLKAPTLKRVLVAIMVLEIPIQFDVYLAHDAAVSANNSVSGFNLSVTTLCLFCLYLLWGVERLANPGRRFSLHRGVLPAVLYFIVVTLSAFIALDATLVFFEITIIGQSLLIFLYILHIAKSRRDVLFIVTFLLVGLVLQGLVTLALSATGGRVGLGPVQGNRIGDRVGGTLGAPNALGSYLTLAIAPAAGLLLTKADRVLHRLAAMALLLGLPALTLSLSRGAWVANVVSLSILALLAFRRGLFSKKLLWILGSGALLVVVFFGDDIVARAAEFDNGAAMARFPLYQLALRVIGDNPILGVGANNFAEAMQDHLTVSFSQAWISTVHNKYLLVWAETGIIGLGLFLWFMISSIRNGWLVWKAKDSMLSPLALAMGAAFVGTMFHMLVAIFHARSQTQMLWLIAGLLLAMRRIVERDRHRVDQVAATVRA